MLLFITSLSFFPDSESLYWFCALTGTGLFMIQLILTFIGLGDQEVDEAGVDVGKVKWLSRQALTGFLMMFGWTALTSQKELFLDTLSTLILSITIGIITVFFSGLIFNLVKKLQSPGSVFRIEEAIGKIGTTYHDIPKGGIGKILISINDMTQEINAVSQNREMIPSFTTIKIINILDTNTVIIEKI